MRKILSKYAPDTFEPPNLVQVQLDSYQWFLDVGLKELLNDISPIEDWTGKEMELRFLDFKLEEPKFTERVAREKNITFELTFDPPWSMDKMSERAKAMLGI